MAGGGLFLSVNYVHEASHRSLLYFPVNTRVIIGVEQVRISRHTNPHTKPPTLLREGLLEDALVKAAERRAEVLEV